MDHWLSLGLSGFRVDMAASLVKDDPGQGRDRQRLDGAAPLAGRRAPGRGAALRVGRARRCRSRPASTPTSSSSSAAPPTACALRSLWNNGDGTVNENWDPLDCFFDAERPGLAAPLRRGVAARRPPPSAAPASSPCPPPTTTSPASTCGPRTAEQLARRLRLPADLADAARRSTTATRSACATCPACPTRRAACSARATTARAPAPPCSGTTRPNAGFSTAPADRLYLPVDPAPDRPTVAAQRADDTARSSTSYAA